MMEDQIAEMLAEWADSGHCKTPEQVARRILALLDAARVEGPVRERPKRGEIRVIGGKRSRFIEADDRGDVWEILDVVTPPADEVGRALFEIQSWVEAGFPPGALSLDDYALRGCLRLILSHVSRLEDSIQHAHLLRLRDERDKAQGNLLLAVEALEKIEQHPGPNGDEGAFWRAEEARDALQAISSLRPSVSAPGGDVEASRQSGGEG